jgi:hypothetical protein
MQSIGGSALVHNVFRTIRGSNFEVWRVGTHTRATKRCESLFGKQRCHITRNRRGTIGSVKRNILQIATQRTNVSLPCCYTFSASTCYAYGYRVRSHSYYESSLAHTRTALASNAPPPATLMLERGAEISTVPPFPIKLKSVTRKNQHATQKTWLLRIVSTWPMPSSTTYLIPPLPAVNCAPFAVM